MSRMVTTNYIILAISLLAVAAITVAVLLFLNRGPDFPSISYVPDSNIGILPGERPGDLPDKAGLPPWPEGSSVRISPYLNGEEKTEAISKKYMVYLHYLKDSYEKELGRLIESAKKDYSAVKRGRMHVPLAKLAEEYIKAGEALEKECDRSFNRIISAMKSELNSHNLPDYPVKQAEKEYEDRKERARNEILEKVRGAAND